MTFKGVTFKNVEKFDEWLNATVKNYSGLFYVFLDDLKTQYNETALQSYELSRYETKSGRTELYDFDVQIVEVDDDEYEMVIIF